MTDRPTREDMETLLNDLEKAAAEGKRRGKGPGAERPGRRGSSSTLIQSEATKHLKELEIKAIERKQALEDQRRMELKKKALKSRKTEEAVHEIIGKFLKE